MRKIATLALLLAATAAGTHAAPAAPLVNIGKLICTIAPKQPKDNQAGHKVSCAFEPRNGAPASYTGRLRHASGPPLLDANRVLIWSVLAPKRDVPAGSIAGRYLSSLSEAPAPSARKLGSLYRQSAFPIELRAQTLTRAAGSEPGLILELELETTKA